jgi:hypothetical protein
MLICFQGDANPRVVALQLLLNRVRRINPGLTVDGHYGRNTANAVTRFREQIMQTSGRGDVVDGPVWLSLISGTDLQVLDIIDVTDPVVVESVVPDVAQFTVPILIGAMSNGVTQAITEIKSRARGNGSLLLIRFHGHGAPGLAAISHGTSRLNPGIDPILAQSVFTIEVVKLLRPLLQGIAPLMHDMGFVEFHSCRVAQGQNGSSMIRDLASIWLSPVSAGLSRQKGGGNLNFILQQPSFTSFPAQANLKTWAASRDALLSVN